MTDPTRTDPHDVSVVWFRPEDRLPGWYEDRKPQGILHERVRAVMVGIRTSVVDGFIVSEAMVLPDGKGVSIGFVRLANFVINHANSLPPRRPPDEVGSVDRPL